jgi:hypothetical protein
MISLEDNRLVFRFEDVHPRAGYPVGFQRTLRIPDDGKNYPLPAGLGLFDIRHLDDFADKLSPALGRRGGVIMPMWQSEAMWLNFGGARSSVPYPFALKIAAGKVNAITGEPWREDLRSSPQDYLVVPEQPWLDGFCVEKGIVRQFVAAPLGEGATIEEQISGKADHGGLQIIAYPMKREVFERHLASRQSMMTMFQASKDMLGRSALTMGLAAGGKMRQEIYADPHGVDAWDQAHHSRCFITIVNAQVWKWLTGANPHNSPPTMADYQQHELPWFDYYAADQNALEGSSILAKVKTVAGLATAASEAVAPSKVSPLGPDRRPVREADTVRESKF